MLFFFPFVLFVGFSNFFGKTEAIDCISHLVEYFSQTCWDITHVWVTAKCMNTLAYKKAGRSSALLANRIAKYMKFVLGSQLTSQLPLIWELLTLNQSLEVFKSYEEGLSFGIP